METAAVFAEPTTQQVTELIFSKREVLVRLLFAT